MWSPAAHGSPAALLATFKMKRPAAVAAGHSLPCQSSHSALVTATRQARQSGQTWWGLTSQSHLKSVLWSWPWLKTRQQSLSAELAVNSMHACRCTSNNTAKPSSNSRSRLGRYSEERPPFVAGKSISTHSNGLCAPDYSRTVTRNCNTADCICLTPSNIAC